MSFQPTSGGQTNGNEVRRTLHETWKKIENVRDQINAATETIQRLKKAERELLSMAATIAPLLSPFQRLPPDIIGEIAGKVVPSILFPSFPTCAGIWPLTFLCKAWRHAILSLPHLWSSFSISDGRIPPLELLSIILKRSRSHPLTFTVSLLRADEFEEVMSLLTEQSERWKIVDIHGKSGPNMFLRIRGRLPRLETLDLHLEQPKNDQWSDSEAERSIFEDAPNLTRVAYRRFQHDFSVKFKFPNHQLRHIELYWGDAPLPANPRGWELENLSLFPNLITLHLRDANWDRSPFQPPPVLASLPILKHLILECNTCLLAALQVPALTSLRIYDIDLDENDVTVAHIRAFLAALQTPLESFMVYGAEYTSLSNIALLLEHSALRQIRTLEIVQDSLEEDQQYHPWVYHFLWRLCEGPPRVIFPRLRNFKLDFNYEREEYGIFEMLQAFIISRTKSSEETSDHDPHGTGSDDDHLKPARLEDLSIRYHPSLPPITLDSIHILASGWVRVAEPSDNAPRLPSSFSR